MISRAHPRGLRGHATSTWRPTTEELAWKRRLKAAGSPAGQSHKTFTLATLTARALPVSSEERERERETERRRRRCPEPRGASAGLGFLMDNANDRMQIDLMFAALFVLAVLAVGLYFLVDRLCRNMIPWQTESH